MSAYYKVKSPKRRSQMFWTIYRRPCWWPLYSYFGLANDADDAWRQADRYEAKLKSQTVYLGKFPKPSNIDRGAS